MRIRLYKSERTAKSITVILLGIAILVAGIVFAHVWNLKKILREESERYFIGIATHISTIVDDRIHNKFEQLGRISKMMSSDWRLASSANMKILQEQLQHSDYAWIGVIDQDYVCRTTKSEPVDLAGMPVIEAILTGAVSRGISSTVGGGQETEFFYAVAVANRQGQVVGALAAGQPLEKAKDLLRIDSFNTEGFSEILDDKGNLVLSSSAQITEAERKNFFDRYSSEGWAGQKELEKARAKMAAGQWGFLHICEPGRVAEIGVYHPLEQKGLYILSIFPDSLVNHVGNMFVKDTVYSSFILIGLFLLVILLLLFIQHKNGVYLKKFAFEDSITGGYNWSKFEIEVRKCLQNKTGQYALVSLDIENFKLINNAFGIEAGNKTLRYIHQVLLRRLKPGEITARAGADKFYVLMEYLSNEQIEMRLEQFSRDLNRFNERQANKYYFKCMAGVFVIDHPELSMFIMQDRVNAARKYEKKDFINEFISVVFFSGMEQRRLMIEKEIDNKMTDALKRREFVVYLQPKYELRYNTIVGAEALVRWMDPSFGLIAPKEFIPVFEKNGFIEKLDLYVFDQVCSYLQGWKESGCRPIPVSINLSRAHFKNADFLEQFYAVFKKYTIPPEWIEFELTETMIFENMEFLTYVIQRFHELGFSCSLDDFGSGYSSLNILKDVPVDVLKLDRGFFSETIKDVRRSEIVIGNVIHLAKELQMKTVAEGVESFEQVKMLRRLQCDMVQGFVFSRPVPVDVFEKMAFQEPDNLK